MMSFQRLSSSLVEQLARKKLSSYCNELIAETFNIEQFQFLAIILCLLSENIFLGYLKSPDYVFYASFSYHGFSLQCFELVGRQEQEGHPICNTLVCWWG